MLAFAWYLLKVMLCSGILFGYYWLALRNKKFHQYNRFYLLITVALSWFIPLMRIDYFSEAKEYPQMVNLLTIVSSGNQYVQTASSQSNFLWDINTIIILAFAFVSAIFFTRFIAGIIKIKLLISKSVKQKLDNIYFIFTNVKGTPFSFFHYIFWNYNISINSVEGEHILKHELVHVQEKHSLDKLFIGLVLISGWYNPFMWFIRKELYMIHEFIADEKAIKDGDTSAFASMILKAAYPSFSFPYTNPFFYSPFKRRLFMLTSSKNTRYTYLRRVAILPLLLFTCLLFAFNIKKDEILLAQNKLNITSMSLVRTDNTEADDKQNRNDGMIESDTIIKGKDEALKGIIANIKISTTDSLGREHKVELRKAPNDTTPGALLNKLFVLNGKIMTGKEFEMLGITSDKIKSINVLKGDAAVLKFGERGRDGVIEISTVSTSITELSEERKFDKIFTKVEYPPVYNGNLYEYIKVNLHYPSEALNRKVEGKVVIKFIVDEDGALSNFKSLTSLGNGLETEAIRLLKNSGPWKPALQNGRKVVYEVKQEINFALNYRENSTSGIIPAQLPGGTEGGRKELKRIVEYNITSRINAPPGNYSADVVFTVRKDGIVQNVRTETKNGYGIDEVLTNLFSNSPRYLPALKDGVPVDSEVRHAIVFKVPRTNKAVN